jgi:two-component system, OmpR family, response regulator MprA
MPALDTILVIEDDGATRDFIAEVLSDEGYTVRAASNAVGGMAALADDEPDLILVDYHLPAANGLTLARSIRSFGITVPIVLMTADNHPPSNLEDVAFCLLKPFELDDLLDCVMTQIRPSKELTAES